MFDDLIRVFSRHYPQVPDAAVTLKGDVRIVRKLVRVLLLPSLNNVTSIGNFQCVPVEILISLVLLVLRNQIWKLSVYLPICVVLVHMPPIVLFPLFILFLKKLYFLIGLQNVTVIIVHTNLTTDTFLPLNLIRCKINLFLVIFKLYCIFTWLTFDSLLMPFMIVLLLFRNWWYFVTHSNILQIYYLNATSRNLIRLPLHHICSLHYCISI